MILFNLSQTAYKTRLKIKMIFYILSKYTINQPTDVTTFYLKVVFCKIQTFTKFKPLLPK